MVQNRAFFFVKQRKLEKEGKWGFNGWGEWARGWGDRFFLIKKIN